MWSLRAYHNDHAKNHNTEHLRPPMDRSKVCTAFADDHRRCRLVQEANKKTCIIHKNYYKNWFEKHHPHFGIRNLTKRKLAELEFQILEGHVVPTKDYVLSIATFSHMVPYYLLLCRGGTDPMTNPNMFHLAVEMICHDALLGMRYDPERSTNWQIISSTSINTLLVKPEYCIIVLQDVVMYLLRYIEPILIHQRLDEYQERILEVWDLFLSNSNMIQILKSQEFKEFLTTTQKSIRERAEHFLSFYMRNMETLVTTMMQTSETIIRSRVQIYKEELMAYCWSPERIEKYLGEQGNFDALDDL